MGRRRVYPDWYEWHAILSGKAWRGAAAAHEKRIDQLTAAHRARQARGEKHPVEDFLFTYYPTRPGRLRRWHPGFGVALLDAEGEYGPPWYRTVRVGTRDFTVLDERKVLQRVDAVRWVHDLNKSTATKPWQIGCAGLHEWAMVYGLSQDEVRHSAWPLRVAPSVIRDTVDEVGLRCTHFDAYRFFTDEAVPLNPIPLTRADVADNEQPGCLHFNMDLYKHALALTPIVSSDLVRRTFELARDLRALDMRGAPYDLSELGIEPIPVETKEGRFTFARKQHSFAIIASVTRGLLIFELERVLTAPFPKPSAKAKAAPLPEPPAAEVIPLRPA